MLHQVKTAKSLYYLFWIPNIFFPVQGQCQRQFHVKCSDQIKKQYEIFFFLQETTEQKKSEGGGKGKKIIPKKLLHAGWTYGSVGRQITASI